MHHNVIDNAAENDMCEESGCVCQGDLIWNEETETCIRASQCPCHHAGKSFEEGQQISKDCNTW